MLLVATLAVARHKLLVIFHEFGKIITFILRLFDVVDQCVTSRLADHFNGEFVGWKSRVARGVKDIDHMLVLVHGDIEGIGEFGEALVTADSGFG